MFEEVDIQPRLVFHESLPLTLKQGSSGPWSDVILATATFYQDHASQIRKEGRPPKLSVMVGQAWTFFGLKRFGGGVCTMQPTICIAQRIQEYAHSQCIHT